MSNENDICCCNNSIEPKIYILAIPQNKIGVLTHMCTCPNDCCECYLLNINTIPATVSSFFELNVTFVKNKSSKFNIGVENWNNNNLTDQIKFFCISDTIPAIPRKLSIEAVQRIEIQNSKVPLLILQMQSNCILNCFTF